MRLPKRAFFAGKRALHFIGNVDKRSVFSVCDVVVCDGFTGNIALKTLEERQVYYLCPEEELMAGTKTKIGAFWQKTPCEI